MKTVIVALNSKYIHSALAPWYLKYACSNCREEIKILEYSINDDIEWILSKIFLEKPDVAAFSCYIWNITHILKIAGNLKKVLPNIIVILGGPEVSYEPQEIMGKNDFIDYIICGEGEESFQKLLSCLYSATNSSTFPAAMAADNLNIGEVEGLCYRNNGENCNQSSEEDVEKYKKIIYDGKYCLIKDLDSIPSPYTDEMLGSLNNKIVYYEASRGCPFSCSYCISSTFDGVRYLSMDRVKKDILRLIGKGVKQVKFVDRTFNCNKKRAKEIIRFVIEQSKESNYETNFHFEAAGDLFDDEMIQLLSTASEGVIQLEIGVQTTNEETLDEINRRTDTEKVFDNIRLLKSEDNIHIHLDLIAGLPFENYISFQESFNRVYALEPHQLQLGFLKMLKGSHIRNYSEKHGYKFREYPPYEVLNNKYISFSEMSELKGIEEVFERYYNSGRFKHSLKFVIGYFYDSPFDFYRDFYLYNFNEGHLDKPLSARDLYTVFAGFAGNLEKLMVNAGKIADCNISIYSIMNQFLKLDFLSTNNTGNLPEGINRTIEPGFKEKCHDFLKDSENISRYCPHYKNISAGQILKRVQFETFEYDILSGNKIENIEKKKVTVLFDYTKKHKVTGVYSYSRVSL
ncbi:MAG TPA: B12-binding domain-containing radical SAM protein [Clostridiales bacterium]|nr:B12-binding domain-containing radical SAM protein [Clostridiales bacterium]